MAEEGKKISFGFSKSIKKTVLKNVAPQEEKKVDYIECVDDKSIKIIGGEELKDEPLIIPMLGSKTWHDRILNKVDADIFEPKTSEATVKNEPITDIQIKQEKCDFIPNGNLCKENNDQPMDVSEIKKEFNENEQQLTLEEQAAREIIADLKPKVENKEQNNFTVPVTDDDNLRGTEQSTLEDYENIPIDVFGMAMLRGMGWQPGKGIGKNQKVVPPSIPELRPKGMGLGADKLTIQKAKGKLTKEEEQLKLIKGSYVKVIAGKYINNYGKVEGFDEEAARVILKLAIGGETISVNESLVQLVSSTEYTQNAKVLNVKKYEEYKSNEVKKNEKTTRELSRSTDDEDSKDSKSKHNEKSNKKMKKRRHQSSDDDSSRERKSRRKRDSSNSSTEVQKQKKSKKLKKHKSRDSSAERSSRKNRKKDKEREKIRHKKLNYSDSSERSRNKHHKRSRSRSRSPRHRKRDRSRS